MNYIFDPTWFQKHQKGLLWLSNTLIVKYWFRWVLRINKDCSFKERIIEITPNSYKVNLGLFFTKQGLNHIIRVDFRTHNKFSKRLYYAFYPLWLIFHIWDLFADNYVPQLSFGFSTLTVYPDAHPESTSVDGCVSVGGKHNTWAELIAFPGSSSGDTNGSEKVIRIRSSDGSGKWNSLWRGIFLFDTSALGSGVTISAATLSLWGYDKIDQNSITPDINIYSSNPASNTALAAGDFDSLGSTAFSTAITYAGFSITGYNDFVLNASGKTNISKTEISKFGARNANYDVAASSPSWSSQDESAFNIRYAEYGGNSNDPKLVITYMMVYTLTASVGAFILTGVLVNLSRPIINVVVSVGAFVLTGIGAGLSRPIINMIASVGTFTLTGINVGLSKCYNLVASVGQFILTGKNVNLLRPIINMFVSVGQFTLAGIDTTLKYTILKLFKGKINILEAKTKANILVNKIKATINSFKPKAR